MTRSHRTDGEARRPSRKRRSQEFLRRSGELFLKEAPARMEELWAAGKAKDRPRVARAAHTLGCLAGNLDGSPLTALAAAAEAAADGDELSAAQLPEILFELEIAYAETRACLERARDKAQAPAAGRGEGPA